MTNGRKIERKTNFYAKASEARRALFLNKPMIVLLYKEPLFNTNQLDTSLLSSIVSLLQEFEDVFPKEIPKGLPHIRGIEHQIDFFPVLPFRTDPLIRVIPRRQRNSKSKLMN